MCVCSYSVLDEYDDVFVQQLSGKYGNASIWWWQQCVCVCHKEAAASASVLQHSNIVALHCKDNTHRVSLFRARAESQCKIMLLRFDC